ncbi:MAG: hypothetical protein Q8920_11995 [Bacillota bacterium]|nr:hypothetical protein [Bacillota bacterium]
MIFGNSTVINCLSDSGELNQSPEKINGTPAKTFAEVLYSLSTNNDSLCTGTQSSTSGQICDNYMKAKILKAEQTDAVQRAENKEKVKAAIGWLANYLGIPPSLLLTIFQDLKINPDDMADPMKLPEIINKIVQYFKLSQDKEDEITRELNGIFGFA